MPLGHVVRHLLARDCRGGERTEGSPKVVDRALSPVPRAKPAAVVLGLEQGDEVVERERARGFAERAALDVFQHLDEERFRDVQVLRLCSAPNAQALVLNVDVPPAVSLTQDA